MELTLISNSWYDLPPATIIILTGQSDGLWLKWAAVMWMFCTLLFANDN